MIKNVRFLLKLKIASMSQNSILSSAITMTKVITRRRPFILLAIFIFVVILTVIINSNNGSHVLSKNGYYKMEPVKKFEEDPNDEFLKIEPNFHASNDGNKKSLNNLQGSVKHKEKKPAIGYVPERRIVHLDLKGAAPKMSYLLKLIPLFKQAGATGLLIEWEDMFPFEGNLSFAKHEYAYSKDNVLEILKVARANRLEVIPLIQAFGHLEYFLKLEEYRSLRELDAFPQTICPSKSNAVQLVKDIIDQVMALHQHAQFIHIGCDEVYQLGSCDKCKQTNRDELFLNHVTSIAKYVKDKYKINSIMWDDMLRQFSEFTLKNYDFKAIGLEVMIWTYIDDIYRFIPTETWSLYATFIPNIWGASAFKGAFGETLILPNVKMHLDNNIAWLTAMKEQSRNMNLRGLVITGWQRYDHLGNLCELLPTGIPSLIINLLTISKGYYDPVLFERFDDLLHCEQNYESVDKNYMQNNQFLANKRYCNFPGSKIFQLMQNIDDLIKRTNDYLYDVTTHKAWLTDFNERHNITNPLRIQEALQNYFPLYDELKRIITDAFQSLSLVFQEYTALEWIEQKLYPLVIRMETFYNRTQKLDKLRTWPKRPIGTAADLKRLLPKKTNLNF